MSTSPKHSLPEQQVESPCAKRVRATPSILSVGPWAAKQQHHQAAAAKVDAMDVTTPVTGDIIAQVKLGGASDVDAAVSAAAEAFPSWSSLTQKRRAAIMLKFHNLCTENSDELVQLIMKENGKNITEAQGDLAKGLETVEWACSIPHVAPGRTLAVSGGVTCQEIRDPVGVVACIVPFNFPFMVPMWTTPIALVAGNCVVLKPSEKVPMTMSRVAELLEKAGVPAGVFQMVQGAKEVVDALCDHPGIRALTFVGSSRVAKLVHERALRTGKKALALGGAKNHLVAAADCDLEMASSDIVASFAGCAGQRCMAASVLLTLGAQPALVAKVVEKAAKIEMGQGKGCMGPVIDAAAESRVTGFVDAAERDGAKILLDGRKWASRKHGRTSAEHDGASLSGGHWVGPTVIEMPTHLRAHPAMSAEIFGPVLCVHAVPDAATALKIERADPHGNAACIYTSSGATADWFSRRFNAAMVGVNIGVPVPREPFSFGGLEGSLSKFGEHDITGEGGLNFFTSTRKITTKWANNPDAVPDAANFGGVM